MSENQYLGMMLTLFGIAFLLYKIWSCLDDIRHALDQSNRLDEIERRMKENRDGDEWKYHE